MKTIGRNCFARYDIIRERANVTPAVIRKGCDWCGQTSPNGKLFRYGHDSDGGRTGWIRGLFCSYDCCKSFNG